MGFSESAEPVVERGPFGVENLIAGFWVLKYDGFEQALDFAKKVPFKKGKVEVRQIAGPDDFEDSLSEEIRAGWEEARKKK